MKEAIATNMAKPHKTEGNLTPKEGKIMINTIVGTVMSKTPEI